MRGQRVSYEGRVLSIRGRHGSRRTGRLLSLRGMQEVHRILKLVSDVARGH